MENGTTGKMENGMTGKNQGFKLQHNLTSMDFNSKCTHFAAGGKESNSSET